MSEISQILFLVSDSLLISNIIVLLVLFVRVLLLVGSFYNRFIAKYKNDRPPNEVIRNLTPDTAAQFKDLLPERDNALYIQYLRDFVHHTPDEAYYNYMISNFENEAEKDIATSKLSAKVGPVLGLIDTLIAMSPALTGLSTGDISKMASNMRVIFATTVVGLVISLVGLVTLQFKQHWYSKEIDQLDYVSSVLTKNLK